MSWKQSQPSVKSGFCPWLVLKGNGGDGCKCLWLLAPRRDSYRQQNGTTPQREHTHNYSSRSSRQPAMYSLVAEPATHIWQNLDVSVSLFKINLLCNTGLMFSQQCMNLIFMPSVLFFYKSTKPAFIKSLHFRKHWLSQCLWESQVYSLSYCSSWNDHSGHFPMTGGDKAA